MKNASRILYVTSVFLILFGVLFGMLHYRGIFQSLVSTGISLFIIYCVTLLFGLDAKRMYQYNDKFNAMRKGYNIGMLMGVVILLFSVFLKIMHVGDFKYLTIAGLIIIILFLILFLALHYSKNKYLVALNAHVNISEADLNKYTGAYFSDILKETMDVWVEHNNLNARLGGQSSFQLFAIKVNIFNCIENGIVIEFHPEKGELILIQSGRYLPFIKK